MPPSLLQRLKERKLVRQARYEGKALESVQGLVPRNELAEGVVHLIREPPIWAALLVAALVGLITQTVFGHGWLGILAFSGIEALGIKRYLLRWTETGLLLCRAGKWSGLAIALENRLPNNTPITRVEKLFGERVQINGVVYVLSPDDGAKLRVKMSHWKSPGGE